MDAFFSITCFFQTMDFSRLNCWFWNDYPSWWSLGWSRCFVLRHTTHFVSKLQFRVFHFELPFRMDGHICVHSLRVLSSGSLYAARSSRKLFFVIRVSEREPIRGVGVGTENPCKKTDFAIVLRILLLSFREAYNEKCLFIAFHLKITFFCAPVNEQKW